MREELYIGLMSGTSMDGIDAVLVRFDTNGFELIAADCTPWPNNFKAQLRELASPGRDGIDQLGSADAQAGEYLADAALCLLKRARRDPSAISAIGSHGQTIRHRPTNKPPFTLQIGDPNRIAERTGITTVADFRRRDMAAGGEGAPLVPAFHAEVFRDSREQRAILNIGGIANLTVLPADHEAPVSGFDTGPGNTLLDTWICRHLQQPFDPNGSWAADGRIHAPLLEAMLRDDYFQRPPPKSTGPEYFSCDWLDRHLKRFPAIPPQDIQATLVALTCETISRALLAHAPNTQRVLVCGGGNHNRTLMMQLEQGLKPRPVESTRAYGLDPDWVEAIAFAWLARRTLQGLPGNLPDVTGARHAAILGGIYRG